MVFDRCFVKKVVKHVLKINLFYCGSKVLKIPMGSDSASFMTFFSLLLQEQIDTDEKEEIIDST